MIQRFNRNNTLAVIITVITLFFNAGLFSQNIQFEHHNTIKGKTKGAEPLGVSSDGMIYCHATKGKMINQEYYKIIDAESGALVNEKYYLREKAVVHLRPIRTHIAFLEKGALLVVESQQQKTTSYYGFWLDAIGNVNSNPILLAEGEECSKGYLISNRRDNSTQLWFDEKQKSEDIVFVISNECEKSNLGEMWHYELSIISFDQELKNRKEKRVTFPNPINGIRKIKNIEGNTYLLTSTSEAKKLKGKVFKKDMSYNEVYRIDEAGNTSLIEMPELYDAYFVEAEDLSIINNEILISGMLYNKGNESEIKDSDELYYEKMGIVGIFNSRVDIEENMIIEFTPHFFNDEFVTQYMTDKEKNYYSRVNTLGNDIKYIEQIETSDGGVYSILQNKFVEVRRSHDYRGASTIDRFYYYDYIFVAKINKAGLYEWIVQLPTFDVTLNYNPGKSVQIYLQDDVLQILHRTSEDLKYKLQNGHAHPDLRKQKDQRKFEFGLTSISPDGRLSYQSALPFKTNEITLSGFSILSFVEAEDGNLFYFDTGGTFNKKEIDILKIYKNR